MPDRRKRHEQDRDIRIAATGAVLLVSFAAAALLGEALIAGLGLTVALWQGLRLRQAAPAPVPARARAGRGRR